MSKHIPDNKIKALQSCIWKMRGSKKILMKSSGIRGEYFELIEVNTVSEDELRKLNKH